MFCRLPVLYSYLDRCGYGTRLPLLVISPFAKQNFVDSFVTDVTSILRFIDDNWSLGRIEDQFVRRHCGLDSEYVQRQRRNGTAGVSRPGDGVGGQTGNGDKRPDAGVRAPLTSPRSR
jgi:hypothetical protein